MAGRDLIEKSSFGSKPNELTIVLTPYIKRQFHIFIKVVETAKFDHYFRSKAVFVATKEKDNGITAKPKHTGVAQRQTTIFIVSHLLYLVNSL